MAADLIRVEVAGGIAELTLDNPPLNLVTLEMTHRLHAALGRLAADPAVRVLIVTGAGNRAFSAGSDVGEFPAVLDDVVRKKLALENEAWSRLDGFPRPTVAALDGLAYGGGLELAACCDLLVAAADVRLALPEVKLGVFPGTGGTVRLPRRIGEGRVKELAFLGEPIDARTALAWGLVNRVVPPGQARPAARELAAVLAARPGQALQRCKEAIALGRDRPADEALARTLALSDAVFRTADCREGARAFLAKEAPRFTHG